MASRIALFSLALLLPCAAFAMDKAKVKKAWAKLPAQETPVSPAASTSPKAADAQQDKEKDNKESAAAVEAAKPELTLVELIVAHRSAKEEHVAAAAIAIAAGKKLLAANEELEQANGASVKAEGDLGSKIASLTAKIASIRTTRKKAEGDLLNNQLTLGGMKAPAASAAPAVRAEYSVKVEQLRVVNEKLTLDIGISAAAENTGHGELGDGLRAPTPKEATRGWWG